MSPTAHENSSLLHPDEASEHDHQYTLPAPAKSTLYLLLSSLGLGGLQIAWAIKYSNLLPYLLSLQIQKSTISLVWVFSPLFGAFVQCYIGMKSDDCRVSYGRRKPFLIGGVLGMAMLFLGLSWAHEIVDLFFSRSNDARFDFLAGWALLFVGFLDLAMNIGRYLSPMIRETWPSTDLHEVEATIRAYIMDVNIASQQNSASAMAGVMLSIGNILGYVLGGFQLVKLVPSFDVDNAQFKLLSFVAVVAVTITLTISLSNIAEPDPRTKFSDVGQKRLSVTGHLLSLPRLIQNLSPNIRKVCQIQILLWTGWFAFLFYSTTWVSEIWIEPFLRISPGMGKDELNELYTEASKVGNSAFILWSSSALFWGLLILWATNNESGASLLIRKTDVGNDSSSSIRVIRHIWATALAILALFLLSTPFITSVWVAMLGMAAAGLPWAATMWAPFAIISNAVSSSLTSDDNHAIQNSRRKPVPTIDGGIALGLNGLSLAIAQVMGSVVAAPIFHVFQVKRGQAGDRSISASFFVLSWFVVGGVYLIIAPWQSDLYVENVETDETAP